MSPSQAPNGDLERYLYAHPDVAAHTRAKWGLQIAEGIALLHANDIVWGDCSPSNILLTAELDVWLCDFEGSALPGAGRNDCAPPRRYRDPSIDVVENFNGDKRVDIFAFGCVILEILTVDADIVAAVASGWQASLDRSGIALDGQRLLVDTVAFEPFKIVVEGCWMQCIKTADSSSRVGKMIDAL
ncbi:kinase-like domain-containing protein [Mycena amicta]|nr:kinase-like domain-containing protein [Mycena amicta]